MVRLLNSSFGNLECGGCRDEKNMSIHGRRVGIKGGNKGIKKIEKRGIESYRIWK
jgi:hypothetical protein